MRAQDLARDLFLIWKDFKTGTIDRDTLRNGLQPVRRDLQTVLREDAALAHAKTATFYKDILDLEPALWTFARVEGVEPTNKHAERVVRHGVIWRKRSFGADNEDGCRFAERILTTMVSRRLQGLPVLAFLHDAIRAGRAAAPAPSLIP